MNLTRSNSLRLRPRIKPVNIAYAAVFLASEESRMITGHILAVDRGIGD